METIDINQNFDTDHLNDKEIDELHCLFNNNGDSCYNFLSVGNFSKKFYDLLINEKIFEPKENDDYYYLGVYYGLVRRHYDVAIKYITIGAEKGSVRALMHLGFYYENIDINDDLMKKYYSVAADKGNIDAMRNLGWHYENTEINDDLMKKYYLQAIDKGDTLAMRWMANYYRDIECNNDLAKKYYLKAIDNGDSWSMFELAKYYGHIEVDYNMMKKYYLMAIDKGINYAMYILGIFYQTIEKNYEQMKKYFLMAINNSIERACYELEKYYGNNPPSNNDLQNYLSAIINGEILLKYTLFNMQGILKNKDTQIINLFCKNINQDGLDAHNFEYCIDKIITYMQLSEYNKSEKYEELIHNKHIKYIGYFMNYITKLYYNLGGWNKLKNNKNNKNNETDENNKKILKNVLNTSTTQIFIEYLDLYYYKYMDKLYMPGGEGYVKTQKHFKFTINYHKK
jgi:TPR repeat protein